MPNRKGKKWTINDVKKLRIMAREGATISKIEKELGRTKNAIYIQASKINTSLKPKDR